MTAPFYIGKRKVRLRFVLFVMLFIVGSAYIYKMAKASHIYSNVTYKEITMINNCPVLVIRNETAYNTPIYGKAALKVSDGEMVNKDQHIALLYKENFDEQTTNQLYLVQEKIIKYQQEKLLDQVLEDDLAKLNKELDKLVNEIRCIVNDHNLMHISRKETEIRSLLNKKYILLDLRTEPDSYLSKLYTDEAALLGKIKEWVIDINAPESGFISFSVDGYENILGIDSLNKLTVQDFIVFMSNDKQSINIETAKAEHPFYKIINPESKWYAVFEKPIEECYYKVGDSVNVKLKEDRLINATVDNINIEQDKALISLGFETDIEQVINDRKTTVNIEKTAEGLAIPEKAIYNIDDSLGVYILRNDKEEFINVIIKAESNGIVIIEPIIQNQIQLNDKVRLAQ